MRRRLCVVCPDLRAAQQTMNDLLLARIDDGHIHVLARNGVSMEGLHEANVLQKTDVVHGAQTGFLVGGALGIVLGVILVLAPPGNFQLPLATILITVIGGAFFGGWASSMVAAGIPNTRLLAFAGDIEDGKYLMMVDVPYLRVEEIQDLIHKRHPEDRDGGIESSVPAFP